VAQRLHARELRAAHSHAEVGGGQLGATPKNPDLLLLLLEKELVGLKERMQRRKEGHKGDPDNGRGPK
jgi:hypothetical protein